MGRAANFLDAYQKRKDAITAAMEGELAGGSREPLWTGLLDALSLLKAAYDLGLTGKVENYNVRDEYEHWRELCQWARPDQDPPVPLIHQAPAYAWVSRINATLRELNPRRGAPAVPGQEEHLAAEHGPFALRYVSGGQVAQGAIENRWTAIEVGFRSRGLVEPLLGEASPVLGAGRAADEVERAAQSRGPLVLRYGSEDHVREGFVDDRRLARLIGFRCREMCQDLPL